MDVVSLKYMIPKIEYVIMPSQNQVYTLSYRKWNSSSDNNNPWTDVSSNYIADIYGLNDGKDTSKEEYLALLTKITENMNGFADGQFHKWTIKWLPNKTVLYVDDVKIRENKCFVPNNVMKLTLAGWFPTMKLASTGDGVIDSDGIYGTSGALISPSNTKHIGTWAGNKAEFDIKHLYIKRVRFTHFTEEESSRANMLYHPETYPQDGLRELI